LPSCRDGGDLSYGGSFPKSDTNGGEPEERMEDGNSSLLPSETNGGEPEERMEDGNSSLLPSETSGGAPEERTVDGISIAVLSRWRRSVNLGTT
jgi:hypothetical protein